MTLIELVVVMVLLPVILGLSSTALISSMQLQTKSQLRANAQNQNRTGYELLTRLLRQATYPQQGSVDAGSTIITDAEPNRIVFTSRLAGGSTVNQYVFQVVGSNLVWAYVGPTLPCPASQACTYATPTPNRVAVTGVRDATICPDPANDGAVFHYWKLDANSSVDFVNEAPMTQPITVQGDLASVAVVQIDLYTKTSLGPNTPGCEPLTGYVDLRNRQ